MGIHADMERRHRATLQPTQGDGAMMWDNKPRKNKWHIGFAWLPMQIREKTIWLERYIYQGDIMQRRVDFYEGCAERVGYPCDCFRHDEKL
jgi:hypothetical protein